MVPLPLKLTMVTLVLIAVAASPLIERQTQEPLDYQVEVVELILRKMIAVAHRLMMQHILGDSVTLGYSRLR
jgi:hypothetical protein